MAQWRHSARSSGCGETRHQLLLPSRSSWIHLSPFLPFPKDGKLRHGWAELPHRPQRCRIPTHLPVGNAAVALEAADAGGGGAVPQLRGRAAGLPVVAQQDVQHRRRHRAHQRQEEPHLEAERRELSGPVPVHRPRAGCRWPRGHEGVSPRRVLRCVGGSGAGPGSLPAAAMLARPTGSVPPAGTGLSPSGPSPCPSGTHQRLHPRGAGEPPGGVQGSPGGWGLAPCKRSGLSGARSPGGSARASPPRLVPGLLRGRYRDPPTHSQSRSPGSPTCAVQLPPCLRGYRPAGQGPGPGCLPGAASPVPGAGPTHRAGSHRRVPHPARSAAGGPRRGGAERARPEPAPGPPPAARPAPRPRFPGSAPARSCPRTGTGPAPNSCVPPPIPASLPALCLGSDPTAPSPSGSALSGSPPALQPPCPLSPLTSGQHQLPMSPGTPRSRMAQDWDQGR